MPRKYKALPEYYLLPDPRYDNKTVSRFINTLMRDGKKSTAQRIFYDALNVLKKKVADQLPINVFVKAVENAKPQIETKSRRVGGATYQVPVQVQQKRALSLAVKWIITSARSKKGRPMAERLADEIIASFKNEGESVKKRDEVHRMAESNRAFAHLAF